MKKVFNILFFHFLFINAANAGSITSFAFSVADSVDSKYSKAINNATQAFFIQSGIGPQIDFVEKETIKNTTKKIYSIIGNDGAVILGTTLYVAKCVRDQKIATKIFNPFFNQKHDFSFGSDGLEISGVKSFFGTAHWLKMDQNKYSTGVNISF